MFAVNRNASVPGRIKLLIVSMMTIRQVAENVSDRGGSGRDSVLKAS
jgi:hypothetical protein